jgi:hypothetical protein
VNRPWVSKILEQRFWVAAVTLFIAMLISTVHAQWGGDFWEHAAVVRELAARPFHPHHPLLALDVPHAFFSPYSLALGLVARFTGLGHIATLGAAGLLNLVLVITGIRALSRRLFSDGDRASFWALLFVLFLWGSNVWVWSGFLHFAGLGYVLPYPSTFAAGLTLHSMALYLRSLDDGRPWLHVPLALFAALALISHPITAAVMFAGLGACFLGHTRDRFLLRGTLLAVAAGTACVLAASWPYYSWIDLVLHQSAEFDLSSRNLYEDVLARTWPSLLVAPALIWRLRASRRDVLLLWLLLLFLLYGYGAVSPSAGVGRCIAYIGVVLQLAAAGLVSHLEVAREGRWRRVVPVVALATVGVLSLQDLDAFSRSSPFGPVRVPPVAFLADRVGPIDVVLTDLDTGWAIPAYAGRVVATHHPLYWVSDREQRRDDVRRFFEPVTDSEERRRILRRWDVRFLVLNRGRLSVSDDELASIAALGRTVASRNGLVLVDVQARTSP